MDAESTSNSRMSLAFKVVVHVLRDKSSAFLAEVTVGNSVPAMDEVVGKSVNVALFTSTVILPV